MADNDVKVSNFLGRILILLIELNSREDEHLKIKVKCKQLLKWLKNKYWKSIKELVLVVE